MARLSFTYLAVVGVFLGLYFFFCPSYLYHLLCHPRSCASLHLELFPCLFLVNGFYPASSRPYPLTEIDVAFLPARNGGLDCLAFLACYRIRSQSALCVQGL